MTEIPHRSATRSAAALRGTAGAAVLLVLLLVSACGVTVPTDPDGTLDSVRGATMHVGVSPDPGLTEVGDAEPSGPLVDLTEDYAASLDARIEWTVGSEETLVAGLESGDLDLAIGGFTGDTPWIDRAGITRGYANIAGADGRRLVWLVPLGENAFLSNLEVFLDEEAGS